jgi:predicted methyltransferase
VILDTCGGLGYFAAWCLQGQAASVLSYEKNPDVIWLRSLNPWSATAAAELESQASAGAALNAGSALPAAPPLLGRSLTLVRGDVAVEIGSLPDRAFDAVLHDPPRFGIAGELYSQVFYDHLARVLKPRGVLFHYTGTPNKLTSGRDVPKEVATRLRQAGFSTEMQGDGVLAVRRSS